MAENSDDDKTEEPTDRRLEKARDDGQVARSQDLTIAITMILVATTFFMFGGYFFRALAEVFSSGFVFDRRILFSPQILPAMFGKFAVDGLLVVAPIWLDRYHCHRVFADDGWIYFFPQGRRTEAIAVEPSGGN